MTNALRSMSFGWRKVQQDEMQRVFDRPSRFTLSAPRVEFNHQLIGGGPLGDRQLGQGSRFGDRYQNQAIWKLDDTRGRNQKDLPAGYIRPHILGTRSYAGGTQRALNDFPLTEGLHLLPLSPNPPYVRPQSYKGRPLGGVYSAALQSLGLIGAGAIGAVGVANIRRPFFVSTSLDPGALPPGIYRRQGRLDKPGRSIGLFFHLTHANPRHRRDYDWSEVSRRHILNAWPRLFRAEFARSLHSAANGNGRQLPSSTPLSLAARGRGLPGPE